MNVGPGASCSCWKVAEKNPNKSTYKVDVVYPRFLTLDGPSIFSFFFFFFFCMCRGGGGGGDVCVLTVTY